MDGTGRAVRGFGPLVRDADGRVDLPAGFSYRVLSTVGDAMDDGLRVPGQPDGMHAFRADANTTVLLRNHELDVGSDEHAFGAWGDIPERMAAVMYDPAVGAGGVTTMVVDEASGLVRRQFLSLAGTLRNCAGGATPWGSWVSCEESVVRAGERGARRDHGYAFEVSAAARGLTPARPLLAMGRFHREAVAVDAATGIVYQSEDRSDGLFYRFIPRSQGRLAAGGRLEALALEGFEGGSTANRGWSRVPALRRLRARWVALEDPQSRRDDLRERGNDAGASTFFRGEGLAVDRDAAGTRIWLQCTQGGARGHGQLWCYRPSTLEGQVGEASSPGTMELFLEPVRASLMDQGDNLALTPYGDVVLCEESSRRQRVLGITREGGVYTVASNPRGDSEFAGATFAPGGRVMYLNLQVPGLTLAIVGPWERRSDALQPS